MEEMVIWESRLDNKFDVRVIRESASKGNLVVELNGDRLYSKEVYLSYGATFGPDISDIGDWQKTAADYIDNEYNKK